MTREEKFNDYAGFVEKFKPKKTTDDCYTPPMVYEAVKDWACRRYGITEVSLQGNNVRFTPLELAESAQLRLQRLYDHANYKPTVSTVSVPRPKGVRKSDGTFSETKFGGEPLRDVALLTWCAEVLAAVTGREAAA